jgi:hypothetical protein
MGAKTVHFDNVEGTWEKVGGIWTLIIGAILQNLRDTIFYVYCLKKGDKSLKLWKYNLK